MIDQEFSRDSLRAVLLGLAAFVVVSVAMIAALQAIGLDRVQTFIAAAGPLGPLAYIALKTITNVIAPLSSGPVQLASGVVFGLWPAVFYSLLGELLGGTISFLLARYLGRPVVERLVTRGGLARVDAFAQQLGGWRALLYGRLFLFSFYDLISYAAGFTRAITLRQYVLVSLAGIVPSFLNVAVGVMLVEQSNLIPLIYASIALVSLVPLGVSYHLRRRQAKANPEAGSQ